MKSLRILTLVFLFLIVSCDTINEPVNDTIKLNKPTSRVPDDLGLGGRWDLSFTHSSGCYIVMGLDMLETNWNFPIKTWYNVDDNGNRFWEVSITGCSDRPYDDLWWWNTWTVGADNSIYPFGIFPTTANSGTIRGFIQYVPQSPGQVYWLTFDVAYERASPTGMYKFTGGVDLETGETVTLKGKQLTRVPYHNHQD